ncbi:DUF3306 domain-containing protein [Ottowia thiooxydans]|uniref:DUF3306 domain-containing protein n=1 Tax=Ottowia thiooxydans TaxID=219182 RepID=UPI00042416BD|nr:DUF3306 domain-containing protein [Ottowia thiooxydans]
MAENDGFLSRWSQRKVRARQNDAPAAEPTSEVAVPGALPTEVSPSLGLQTSDAQTKPAPPTLDDVAALHKESDFTRFVTPEVSGDVRNAALKKLFTDPHFNVMDGLDTYIEDYNTPDPLPASMLKKMAQAAYLGLVEPEEVSTEASAQEALRAPTGHQEEIPHECAAGNVPEAISHAANPDAAAMKAHDEDPDLRLQSHHDPGPPGPGSGAGGNTQG